MMVDDESNLTFLDSAELIVLINISLQHTVVVV